MMQRRRNMLYPLEDTMVIVFFVLVFFVLFLQFFTRYVLNNSLGWTEEVARMLLICLCFVGAIVNAREGSEISLEFTQSRLSPKWAIRLDILVKMINSSLYFWLAGLMAYYAMKSRQYLSSVLFPKKYIIALVAFSFLLMGFHTVTQMIKAVRKRKEH